jgi:7-carboxy-7-deazaguanine synthase
MDLAIDKTTQDSGPNPGTTRLTATTLLVNELYRSIQGESSYAGWPCSFVRLTGCPLRCVWCDSAFAFTGGRRMSLDEIMQQVAALGLPLVEVTGGEPLAQPGCLELLRRLCDGGYQVLLETSGALDITPVDPRVIKIVDVKCPGSGEAQSNRWENLARLAPRDELKFVLAGRQDYEWACGILKEYGFDKESGLDAPRPIHFSPVHGALRADELAAWILQDALPVRLQLQLHKILWPDRTQGV